MRRVSRCRPRPSGWPRAAWLWAIAACLVFSEWGHAAESAPAAAGTSASGSQAGRPADAELVARGRVVYRQLCAECHGQNGEGVPDRHEEPLRGRRTLEELVKLIDETMPSEAPEKCTGSDARAVAVYVHQRFYSGRISDDDRSARWALSHWTAKQYPRVLAAIYAHFVGATPPVKTGGLAAEYFKTRRFDGRLRAERRTDPRIDFDWKSGKPVPGIPDAREFAIRWSGSLVAPDDGEYEIILTTENGARLWLNDPDEPLIDAWVSSGMRRENRAVLRLLGGRAYPLRLELFQYKGKTASVRLEWKPPRGVREVIPPEFLSPQGAREVFVSTVPFPPDDRVAGYERGIAVSPEWDRATTAGAIEFAAFLLRRLDRLTRTDPADANRREAVRRFVAEFAEVALRRPLSEADRRLYIERFFSADVAPEVAAKRAFLLILKSPAFLYPTLERRPPDDFDRATRLAFALWDSIPDRTLRTQAAKGQLRTPQQVESQIDRMLKDPRARFKVREALHEWLMLDAKDELVKDEKLFPDFDAALASDLRRSLDRTLEEVVWGPNPDYRRLFSEDAIYVNERLARFYGIPGVSGDGFVKVEFEPQYRAGILTHPYIMSMWAYRHLSSPIHRGVFITRRLVGRTLKPPPQATEFKDGDFPPDLTTREKVALLTQPQACQSCHSIINPLGFTLEHFDAVGRFRERENGKPVDATTEYHTVDGRTIRLDGAEGLARLIANSRQAHGTFVDQLFHHLIKQPINAYGPHARERLIDVFEQSGCNIRTLLVEIVKTATMWMPPEVRQAAGSARSGAGRNQAEVSGG